MGVQCGQCDQAAECGPHPERFMDCQDNAARFDLRREHDMHDTKHTPGPWYADDLEPNLGIWSEQTGALVARTQVGQHEDCGILITSSEEEANARLIAAAPDMLEALEAAERLIDEHHAWVTASGKAIGNTVPGLTLFAVRTAIHKARGEEQ